MDHAAPPSLAALTLGRMVAWIGQLAAVLAGLGPQAPIARETRRDLRRKLRQLERVARRLAIHLAGAIELPPLRPPRLRRPAMRGAGPARPARPRPANRQVESAPPPIPLVEPLAGLDTRAAPAITAEPAASVPAGLLRRRLAALEAFAADPQPIARRMARWRQRVAAGRRPGRVFPVPVRPPTLRTGIPRLDDVAGHLHHLVCHPGEYPPP